MLCRAPLLFLGALALFAGLAGGLARLGMAIPGPDMAYAHGALMVGGFLGTVIGLERAVALKQGWAFLAPAGAGLGGLALIAGAPSAAGAGLIAAGSVGLAAAAGLVAWRNRALFTVVMALGALAWFTGNVLWLSGRPFPTVAPFWIAFLALTIGGERLELSRLLRPTQVRGFTAPLPLVLVLGALAPLAFDTVPAAAGRLFGTGLVALTLWLFVYDAARRTVAMPGLTRFIGICLLGGYAWLGIAGMIFLAIGLPAAGSAAYDAALHAVFLGFVFSMIFGHAPVIVPSVLGVDIPFTRWFYAHLMLLHGSLALRLAGDGAGWDAARLWGGAGNLAAILLFLILTVRMAVTARALRRRS